MLRNEEPLDKLSWKKYDGETIIFRYSPIMNFDGLFCWLNVTSPQALDIREELGLCREPILPLHLTVGNCKGD